MTISSTTVKNSYSGNGTLDTFNYTFKIFANADIQVIIRDATGTETVKNLTTHYTVTGAGSASGGTIVFTSGNIPTATETVVLRRASPQTQSIDYIANDAFPAESHEEGLDRSMMAIQQLQEEVDRSIKLSRTNTMNSTEFTIGSNDRAGKIFGFDSNGELVVSQELGTFKGNWSASTTYSARDIVKDTSTNNIFLCNTGHTSSGSQPLTTNTDSAKWDLLVDAASATTSATNTANSATAAATSATNAATSETNAATSETNAATSATNAANSFDSFDDRFLGTKASDPTLDNDGNALVEGAMYYNSTDNDIRFYNGSSWDAPATQAATSATASASSATASATSATNSANSATASASSASAAATSESNASTSETNAASSASAASTSASNASTSETNAASSATSASTSATSAATAQTAAETAQAAAELAYDNFDDRYLGPKASDPTLDNDGNALLDGALYFNTTDDVMKVYDLTNTTWRQIQLSTSDQANVNVVAADLSGSNNIGTVAGLNTEISNLSGLSSEITNLNNIRTDISGVNSIQAAVSAVNTNAVNINAVNSNSANINTVAGLNTEIGLLGTSGTVASINTVASNLADVNAFANIYLGPSATAPTLDPDGSALDVGDLYFDTASQTMKVYSSSGWIPAGSSVNGTSSRFTYTVSSSTTTITGADDNANTLAYDAGFVDVYLNGVKMVNGSDVTVTSGTSIVFASPIGVSGTDVVDIIAFGTFQLANFSINDATDVSTGGVTDGQVLTYNASAGVFQPGNASSAEVYGFSKNSSGELIVTTTDGGTDDIDAATYASFDDVLFSASGFTFSINSDGNLVATI